MPSSLSGKQAIITGASRGIGLAIAKALAANGATRLLLVGRSSDALSHATRSVQSSYASCDIETFVGDVKSRNAWVEISKRMVCHEYSFYSVGKSQSPHVGD